MSAEPQPLDVRAFDQLFDYLLSLDRRPQRPQPTTENEWPDCDRKRLSIVYFGVLSKLNPPPNDFETWAVIEALMSNWQGELPNPIEFRNSVQVYRDSQKPYQPPVEPDTGSYYTKQARLTALAAIYRAQGDTKLYRSMLAGTTEQGGGIINPPGRVVPVSHQEVLQEAEKLNSPITTLMDATFGVERHRVNGSFEFYKDGVLLKSGMPQSFSVEQTVSVQTVNAEYFMEPEIVIYEEETGGEHIGDSETNPKEVVAAVTAVAADSDLDEW